MLEATIQTIKKHNNPEVEEFYEVVQEAIHRVPPDEGELGSLATKTLVKADVLNGATKSLYLDMYRQLEERLLELHAGQQR